MREELTKRDSLEMKLALGGTRVRPASQRALQPAWRPDLSDRLTTATTVLRGRARFMFYLEESEEEFPLTETITIWGHLNLMAMEFGEHCSSGRAGASCVAQYEASTVHQSLSWDY